MGALAFWKAVVEDRSNFLERVVRLLEENGISYCVIGGVGVNAYVEPVVTQDLDIVVAVEDLARARALMDEHFRTREFDHSLSVCDPGSKLQVQIKLDERVADILSRAERREVMDLDLPVASPTDLARLKVLAASEPRRRPSKRQKDLADISRLIEVFPELRSEVPAEIMERLFQ